MKKKSYEYTLVGRSGGEGIILPILLKKGDRFIYDDIVYIVTDFYGGDDGLVCEREYILQDDFNDEIDEFCKLINRIIEHGKLLNVKDIANEIRNVLDSYCLSNRESKIEEQSGIRNNYFEILETLKKLS